ncbi:hypothetical protein [Phyllobacterium phragmitis]|nr:hypothetical protein [Phyllobacterium phragmitis]
MASTPTTWAVSGSHREEETEFVTISYWESVEAMRVFAGNG